ncbi:MAG: hypothetical protein KAS72_05165 [Phycisphaerales bacterium]|nr:hypothetical protein [Phycisphaerales bacterium]
MNDEPPIKLKVSCLHIRHKMMFCDERHAVFGMVDDSSDTRVFYCAKTQDALGPDDAPATPAECTPTRACYDAGA